MAVLHLLANPAAAASCVAAARAGDSLLLLGDGVFALATLDTPARVGVLRADAEARGVVAPASAQRISYAEFVEWVVACERSVTWR